MAYNSTGFPQDLLSTTPYGTRRMQTQNLDFRDLIVSRGHTFVSEFEFTIPTSQSNFLYFKNNTTDYIAVLNRKITTNRERLDYTVYGDFSLSGNSTGDVRTRNLKGDSQVGQPFDFETYNANQVSGLGNILTVEPIFGAEGGFFSSSNGIISGDATYRLLPPESEFVVELANGSSTAIDGQLAYVFALVPAAIIFDGLGPQINY